MKSRIGLIVALLTAVTTVYAFDVKLRWQPNPSSELVTKYIIYQANSIDGVLVPVVTVPGKMTVKTITNLKPGVYRFAVVAQNRFGKSPLSDEVSTFTFIPPVPKTTNQPGIKKDDIIRREKKEVMSDFR